MKGLFKLKWEQKAEQLAHVGQGTAGASLIVLLPAACLSKL